MNHKKNDQILLDCGYDGIENMILCELMENPRKVAPLFIGDEPKWVADVKVVSTGETFTATLP